jgi:hypothetical protein
MGICTQFRPGNGVEEDIDDEEAVRNFVDSKLF